MANFKKYVYGGTTAVWLGTQFLPHREHELHDHREFPVEGVQVPQVAAITTTYAPPPTQQGF